MKELFDGADSFYFIGIGGAGMSALARILLSDGKTVMGCDIARGEYTGALEERGVVISYDGRDDRIAQCDIVVCTDAIKGDNENVAFAISCGKPVIPRGKFLAVLSKNYHTFIAVAGCHGKTTCTSMLAHIFNAARLKFTACIGGNDGRFGNCFSSGNNYFVAEACEYNKNFLLLKPDIAVILNTDADHLECYGSDEKLVEAYRQFADGSKKCVCLAGDRCARGEETFGYGVPADYTATSVSAVGGKYSFDVTEHGRRLCRVNLNVYGRHNILNALAAAAAARAVGINADAVSRGLCAFKGVARRFESIGLYGGCEVIADYAHHPAEIAASLRTALAVTEGELFVIFQPHTYSRTKNLFRDFVGVLSGINNLLVYKTFAAREYFDPEGSALTLAQAVKKSRYGDCVRDIKNFLKNASPGDKILVLGAGDIYAVVREMLG